jgi:DNA primase
MIIRGKQADVDIKYELEQFAWHRSQYVDGKLLACSPFRNEATPSWFCRIEDYRDIPAGTWSDSGATDHEWSSGSFPRLLAFLKGITEEEAEDYLLETYGSFTEGYDEITLKVPELKINKRREYIPSSKLDSFEKDYSYLVGRGISESIAADKQIYFDKSKNAIAIPWCDGNGRIVNMKYRRVDSKIFWYEKGYTPISKLIYNIDEIYRKNVRTAMITEAEIDALTACSVIPAVALGGSNFSKNKAEILIKSPIQHLIIATDNDGVGRKTALLIANSLRDYMKISLFIFPPGKKDINDLTIDEINNGIENAKPLKRFTNFKRAL